MINEHSWHRDTEKQIYFVWSAIISGVELHHSNKNSNYSIPWEIFYSVLNHAQKQAARSNNIVVAAANMATPTTGSIGEWVLSQNLTISYGLLIPMHLSFLGPIYGHMGFITRQLNGNSIQWEFN